MHLSGIFVYPVKSLRGCAVTTAEVDPLGLVGDRRFMVVTEDGRFLSQRTLPRMALISTALSADQLTLSASGVGAITVPRVSDPEAPNRLVSVWKSDGLQADDCGADAAHWLSSFLGVQCRLVRAGTAFHRPVRKVTSSPPLDPAPIVGFADAFPFLIVSEASLADLNDRLAAKGESPLPMDRFRPNLVVAGCPAYAEGTWPRFQLGNVVFRGAGPCARCAITTTDQLTAERGSEPLRTLATYRRAAADPSDVNFGQNLIAESRTGELRIGDRLQPLD
jgi:uncharacterized protein YcbX